MAKKNETLTLEQKWESLTLANNFIFYKVMRNNPEVCRELLEILLEIKIEHLDIHSEETIDIDFESKGIRLDVYAKNETDSYNIELQAINTKELPERARYYQGVMDVDCLKSGQRYRELKNSYVIFICIQDIFNKGLPCYRFENICLHDASIRLNDRTFKYFFIADNCDKILNEKQKSFLKLVSGQKADDSFSKKVEQLAEDAKHNTQWKRQYMEWERQRTYDYEDGKEAGSQQKAIEAATEFLKENISPEIIAKCVKLPLDQVLQLKSQLFQTV